jgi:CDP-glucose 4,6-dehydratase
VGFRPRTLEDLAMTAAIDASFWRGKRVLLTGHTGFKGAWLVQWLARLGAEVTGIALAPDTAPNLYDDAKVETLCRSHVCDIRDAPALGALIRQAQPEIVFHLAAQALVREGYRAPVATFASNVMGTVHVLDALRGLSCTRVAVMVTTDKVYRETALHRAHQEDDALGGADPYSASKAACELVIAGYRDAFLAAQEIAVASARAGNVIGGGDWSADRLIPDAVRAWQAGEVLRLRRPLAVRPWQYVLEPLSGYLILAQKLWHGSAAAGAYNFGPADAAARVRDVVELACGFYGRGEAVYGDGSEGPHESAWLALEVGKARDALGIVPVLTLAEALERTMIWYRAYAQGSDAGTLCRAELAAFEMLMTKPPAATGRMAAGG